MDCVKEELERMLTPKEVRCILQIGRTTMYKMIRNREIPVRKIGRKWRIPKEPFKRWLALCNGMYLPKPCWEIKYCSTEERTGCVIYQKNSSKTLD